MHALNPQNEASSYLLTLPRGMNRSVAINRCTSYLIETHAYGPRDASVLAVQAMAELESMNRRGHIDVDSTTSHVVVFTHHDGRRMAVTLNDLIGFADRQNADVQPVQAARA